jgi:RND superfamily putative drug exporter
MQKFARASFHHRRAVLAVWIVLLVGLSFLASSAGGVFKVQNGLPGSESQHAFDLLKQKGFGDRAGIQAQVAFTSPDGVKSPQVQQAMERFFGEITNDVSGVTIASPYAPANARQISRDGKIAYAELQFRDRSSADYQTAADRIIELRDQVKVQGLRVELGNQIFSKQEFGSEGIGLILAMIILLIAFGSLLAAGLPIATALVGIGCGVAIVKLVANGLNMPDFTTQAVLMISIGVGIDYALFIVTRYREVLESGRDPETSVVVALDTAGRAVLFAGSTVVIALLGLLVLNTETFRGVAIGTAIGVLVTMLASVTLLPALLGFVGRNIDRFGLPRRKQRNQDDSFWHRWAGFVQRRRWPAFIGALVLLVVMALPVFSLRLGFGDAGNKPAGDTSREAYDLLAKGFGPGFNGPLLIAAETPHGASDLAVLTKLSQDLNGTPGVAFATPPRPNPAGDAAIMQVIPTTSPQDKATDDLVDRVRHHVVPQALAGSDVTVAVGGLPAAVDDFANYTFRMLPLVVGLVLLPLKAVIMNLLSVGAAYGVMVAVFQWGWGINLIGVGKEGPIEAWAPLMLFAVVFGLSMDYEVFLLSRIKEEYDRTGDNAQAVADGLAVTARVITAAAAIMVCVFGAFVLGPDRALKVFGLGMAIAVLVDATIVRLVLVPATMELLGDKNWWIPRWLDRILPRIHIEGHPDLDAELAELTDREAPATTA